MRKAQYSTLLMALLAVAAAAPAQGFYRLRNDGGMAVLLRPDRKPMRLRAQDGLRVVAPSPRADLPPGFVDERTGEIIRALESKGFNAIGPGSDAELWRRLPFIESLALSGQLASAQGNSVVDVYAPGFRQQVQDLVGIAVRPRREDHSLIGYMSDDGLEWEPNRQPEILLKSYLALPWTGNDAGRERVVDYLRERYGSNIAALRLAWHVQASDFTTLRPPANPDDAVARDAAGFAALVLARYLSVVAAAIHREDTNHLFLGADLTYSAQQPLGSIWSTADVASVRLQPGQNPVTVVAALRKMTSRPVLLQLARCTDAANLPKGIIGYSCPAVP